MFLQRGRFWIFCVHARFRIFQSTRRFCSEYVGSSIFVIIFWRIWFSVGNEDSAQRVKESTAVVDFGSRSRLSLLLPPPPLLRRRRRCRGSLARSLFSQRPSLLLCSLSSVSCALASRPSESVFWKNKFIEHRRDVTRSNFSTLAARFWYLEHFFWNFQHSSSSPHSMRASSSSSYS